MDQEKIAIGSISHSLLPFSADLVSRKGRNVTCAHNIICDVKNANANILTSSNQNVDAHKDCFLVTAKRPGTAEGFNHIFLECLAEIKSIKIEGDFIMKPLE
ncbi:hypothetical protein [Synechococcus sp. UW140]|uniref:hypothetical protein n=1 Tax=Synechococcus sp. UW140 TaxID=368503 RepID=UPI0025F0827F|nr:hypothetical protein [Synechococcus sp. UW140]